MNNNVEKQVAYTTLQEIRRRKEAVLSEIRRNNKQISKSWSNLFRDNEPRKKGFTLSSVLNTGMGFMDGFFLVWKLYRKFKR